MRPIRFLVPTLALLVAGSLLASPAGAHALLKGRTYHFGTHPARTNITFVSEADLETIHGVTHEMAASRVVVDDAGTGATGTLRVAVGSMKTGIDLRDEHLRSAQWLDATVFPSIDVELVKATEDEDGKAWSYTASITIKGVSRTFQGKARITPIPDEVGKALGDGSWVRVRTEFVVTLSGFGLSIPDKIGAKVSDTWKVGIDLYGTTAAPKPENE